MHDTAIRAAASQRQTSGNFALAVLLVALAGWVDALGIVQWHGLYVSFMSGNTTSLAASPVLGDWRGAGEAGRAVLVFVCGVVLGEAIGPTAGRWRGAAVLAAEAATLWLAWAANRSGWGEPATTSVAGLAMGLQTAVLHTATGTSVALTYVTGTLVQIGRGIAAALRGAAPFSKVLPLLALWIALAAGAAAGAVVARAGLDRALLTAAVAATALLPVAALSTRRRNG